MMYYQLYLLDFLDVHNPIWLMDVRDPAFGARMMDALNRSVFINSGTRKIVVLVTGNNKQ